MGLLDSLLSAIDGGDAEDAADQYGPFNLPPRDRVDLERRAEIIGDHYEELSTEQASEAARILQAELDGSTYSPREIRTQFAEFEGLDSARAREIANVELASIQLEESVKRYLSRDGETEVEWLHPGDGDVHPVCETTAKAVNKRGGVSVSELHSILKQNAEKYQEEGGTPERADHWVFHEGNCRCTITPSV